MDDYIDPLQFGGMNTVAINATRRRNGFPPIESLGSNTPPPSPVPDVQAPPDSPGILETIGDVLDRPGNAVRGLLTGHPENLAGLLPFSESLGLYDHRKQHVSGQDVNQQLLGIPKSDDFFSGAGLAGLGSELLLDPANLLPGFMGIKGATKAGHAAEFIGEHLGQAGKIAEGAIETARNAAKELAAEHGLQVAQGFQPKNVAKLDPLYGELFKDGARVPDSEIVQRLAQRPDAIGEHARTLLSNNAERGVDALKPLENAGDRVRAGQEAFLGVGGHYDPLAILRFGGNYNPINWLPKIPVLTQGVELPQKTLIEGAGAAQGLQDVWRGATQNRIVKPIVDKVWGLGGKAGKVLQNLKEETLQRLRGKQGQIMQEGEDFNRAIADNTKNLTQEPPDSPLPPGENVPVNKPRPGAPGDNPQRGWGDLTPEGQTAKEAQAGLDAEKAMLEDMRRQPDESLQAAALHPDTEEGRAAKVVLSERAATASKMAPDALPLEEAEKQAAAARARAGVAEPPVPDLAKWERGPGGEIAPTELQRAVGEGTDPLKFGASAHGVNAPETRSTNVAGEHTDPLNFGQAVEHGVDAAAELAGKVPQQKQQPMVPRETLASPVLTGDGAAPFEQATLPTREISADPERFQYKRNADVGGATGSTKGVNYNPDLAGTLDVWRDPADGKTYVVNGHNRLDLANRNGVDGMNVRYLPARTAQEARSKGALINIAEKHGTPFDAATFFRETGLGAEDMVKAGVKPTEGMASQGLALSGLSDELFKRALTGELPLERAAMIGDAKLSPDEQAKLFAYLSKKKNWTNGVLQEALDTLSNTGKKITSEETLFGRDVKEESLFGHRMQLQAKLKELLSKERNVAGFAARNADTIEHAGMGQIDALKAQGLSDASAEALYLFDKYKQSHLAPMLNEAAEEVAGGAKASKVAREILEDVKDTLYENRGNAGTREVPIGHEDLLREARPVERAEASAAHEGTQDVAEQARPDDAEVSDPLKFGGAGEETPHPGLAGTLARPSPSRGEGFAPGVGELRDSLLEHFKMSEDEADAIARLTDARAQIYKGTTGRDYFSDRGLEVRTSTPAEIFARTGEKVSPEALAAYEYLKDGRGIIHVLKDAAGAKSALHELGHFFRRDLSGEELEKAAEWAGAGKKWNRAAEEKFVDGFMDYMRTGAAPVPELKSTFEQFRDWIRNVWSSVREFVMGDASREEVHQTFDKLFGGGMEERVRAPGNGPGLLESEGRESRIGSLESGHYGDEMTPEEKRFLEREHARKEAGKSDDIGLPSELHPASPDPNFDPLRFGERGEIEEPHGGHYGDEMTPEEKRFLEREHARKEAGKSDDIGVSPDLLFDDEGVRPGRDYARMAELYGPEYAKRAQAAHEAHDELMRVNDRFGFQSPEWKRANAKYQEASSAHSAELARVKFKEANTEAVNLSKNLSDYLKQAGVESSEAARRGMEIGADLSPDVARRVNDYVEKHAADVEQVSKVGEVLKGEYAHMITAETKRGINTAELSSDEIDYTAHVLTPKGARWWSKRTKTPDQQLEVFTALESKRRGLGIETSEASMAPLQEQRFERMGADPTRGASVIGVPEMFAGKYKDFFERQPKDVQKFMKSQGFQKDFKAFSQEITTAHESQIPRLAAFKDLSVNDINDTMKELGAPHAMFNENPAAQLTVRRLRHERSMAAADFIERAGGKLGVNVEARGVGSAGDGITQGVTKDGEKVWGVDDLHNIEQNTGKEKTWFKDKETADAVQKMYRNFADPQKATGLGAFWDKTTAVFKAYYGKIWPAHQFRWMIGNKLQSFMGGVPLSIPEDALAAKVMAGQDVKFVTPAGTLNGDQVRSLADKYGIGKGGFYDQLLEEGSSMGLGRGEKSWNPLDPNNKAVDAMDRVAATIVSAPTMIGSGATENLKNARSTLLEGQTRLRHFMYELRQGKAPDAAAASVNKYLFDYSRDSMSEFEKNYLTRGLLYYTYTSKVLPLVAQTAVENLNRITPMARLAIQPGKPSREPEYTKGNIALPHGTDKDGNREETYDLGTPLEGAVGPFQHNLVTELHPLIKAPLEAATGRDFFLHKDIEDARSAPHWADLLPGAAQEALGVEHIPTKTGSRTEWNPWAGWALRESPLARASNTASRAADSRKSDFDILGNLFTGSRSVSVDEENEEKFARRDAINARLKELQHQGKAKQYSGFAAAKDAEGNKDAEVASLLKALRR